MIYLYIDEYAIKLFSLSKSLLGNQKVCFFTKHHTSRLIEKGNVTSIDLVASAIKEALTLASPTSPKEKDVCLVLPQSCFAFARYDVPYDISEHAIGPFVKDKIRADSAFTSEDAFVDYILTTQHEQTQVHVYTKEKESLIKYQEALELVGLSLKYFTADTFCYFKLFERVIRKEKKETMFYIILDEHVSFGYVYDTLGLLKSHKYTLKEEELESSLKTKIESLEKEHVPINRIILSGKKSESIRQDLFTKKVGIWTNPLHKILSNFYEQELKFLQDTSSFPLLEFDVCIGAFILENSRGLFSFKTLAREHAPSRVSSLFKMRDIIVFIISFIISFGIIFSYLKFKGVMMSQLLPRFTKATPTPTIPPPTPTATPTPTPVIDKATLKVKILNGGGVRGKASEVKKFLEDAGYGEVLTGNADKFDIQKTEIQVKDELIYAASLMKEDLQEKVAIITVSSLDVSSSADLILIVGQDFE